MKQVAGEWKERRTYSAGEAPRQLARLVEIEARYLRDLAHDLKHGDDWTDEFDVALAVANGLFAGHGVWDIAESGELVFHPATLTATRKEGQEI